MVFRRRPPTSSDRRAGSGSARSAAQTESGTDDEFAREALSYVDSLYGTALRLTRRPADADDLVQDTYLKRSAPRRSFKRART